MENHCTMVHFSLRGSKKNLKGLSPIEVSVSVNGKRIYFSTGKFSKRSEWNRYTQTVKGSTREAQLTNNFLTEFRNRIYEKEVELMRKGYTVTARLLKDAMLDRVGSLKEKTLMQVAAEYSEEKRKLVGRGIVPATFRCISRMERMLREFVRKKYERDDVLLQEVNMGFIQSFHAFILADMGMAQNSSIKYLTYLKSFVNMAVANGYAQCSRIQGYRTERVPVAKDFLTEEELRRLMDFKAPVPRLERARDSFVFGCFTGLSYIDIKTLEPRHFETDGSGRVWIKKRRVKTGVLSRIPLLPVAKAILDKYSGGRHLVPIQGSSAVNADLKIIAKFCNINKRITFHTSRHTFASTVTLANNISIEAVAKMLGHTDTRMTEHYARLLDRYIGEQMDAVSSIYKGRETAREDKAQKE